MAVVATGFGAAAVGEALGVAVGVDAVAVAVGFADAPLVGEELGDVDAVALEVAIGEALDVELEGLAEGEAVPMMTGSTVPVDLPPPLQPVTSAIAAIAAIMVRLRKENSSKGGRGKRSYRGLPSLQ